jgi:hypothetical protein
MSAFLFGETEQKLLASLKLGPGPKYTVPPAYCRAWYDETLKQIVILTKCGGVNRIHNETNPEGEDCGCPACMMKYDVPKHPQYSHDEDEVTNPNYAWIYYNVPPE